MSTHERFEVDPETVGNSVDEIEVAGHETSGADFFICPACILEREDVGLSIF